MLKLFLLSFDISAKKSMLMYKVRMQAIGKGANSNYGKMNVISLRPKNVQGIDGVLAAFTIPVAPDEEKINCLGWIDRQGFGAFGRWVRNCVCAEWYEKDSV